MYKHTEKGHTMSTLMPCWHCRMEIPSGASVCPHCRNPVDGAGAGGYVVLAVILGLIYWGIASFDAHYGTDILGGIAAIFGFLWSIVVWLWSIVSWIFWTILSILDWIIRWFI